ncbi:hypothetical protein CFP56_030898 [Quercus suber]|uniref:DUF2921 domain-containing protein n=1 Tax=Quercus suber TaxID=58331 RepID=A0AAW0JLS1_QUESU
MGLSQNPMYQYQLVDNANCLSGERGGRDKNNININLSLSKLDRGVCFISDGRTSVYELEYWSDCGIVNCNPLRGSIGHLPNWIAFRRVWCDQHSRKVQMLMGFPNPSTAMKFEFPGPNATLIAEGAWDEKDNQLCGIVCRILADASVEQVEIAKGAIESRRSTSDPLYSESFQLSSNSITTTQAKEPIWKMKLEITMVAI